MEVQQRASIRNKIIGILVKRARLEAGKSQRECAEFLGCSPFIFGQYEKGRRGLSLPQLEALAYYFDIPAPSLWDDQFPQPEETAVEDLPLAQITLIRRKILAVQFRQCRQAAGYTQREVGDLLGCSANIVSQYERSKRDIPLAEIEIVAEQCGKTLADFLDEDTIPLGPAEQERQALARLEELPVEVREFVLNPTNALYLRVAMLLSVLKADDLRNIAETILDITY